jgi:hypothetical protein
MWPEGNPSWAQLPCKLPEHAAGKAQELGDPSEHVFLFDVCQKCGISAFNLDDEETCTVINNQHAEDKAQVAKAFGPNDEGVQISGLAFMVNVSAQLVADKINAALAAEREKLEEAERSRSRLQQAVTNGQRLNDALDDNDKLREQLVKMELELQRSNAKCAEKATQLSVGNAALAAEREK